MKNLIVFFAAVVVFTLLFMVPELVQAQPPGLPDAPDQAPLGGLGILAAAGGAYAWKKLRNRSQE
ncbi:MAG: putative membrane protein [Bacteroidetes bacterium HLUCCA01]|nr:MAG: putative membrane protein [Bacteroidetes bacterium HLUCCA01]